MTRARRIEAARLALRLWGWTPERCALLLGLTRAECAQMSLARPA